MDLQLSHISENNFNWIRFWTPKPSVFEGYDFLPDYDVILAHHNVKTFNNMIDESRLILLGSPGIGKSRTTQQIVSDLRAVDEPCLYLALHRYRNFETLKQRLEDNELYQNWWRGIGKLHLFLDGLDEARLNDKFFVHDIMNFLDSLTPKQAEQLLLRVTCRTADLPSDFVAELNAVQNSKGQSPATQYYLAKLRQQDVLDAAEQLSINPHDFLQKLREARATAFAGHPITLDMLFKIYQAEGYIPNNRQVIYARGCERLAREVSDRRVQDRLSGEFEVYQRLEAARHIAAATIIGNRQFVTEQSDTDSTMVKLLDCFLPVEQQLGNKPESLLRETLKTALFMSVQSQTHTWAHRSYGEYLVADFISQSALGLPQIKSLFVNPNDPDERVAPALRETMAWLSTMEEDVFDWLLNHEPTLLMNSESAKLSNDQKTKLADYFLAQKHENPQINLELEWRAYYHFAHPNLGQQLKPYLEDKSIDLRVRDFAMNIAIACEVDTIDQLFLDMAMDTEEELSLRSEALRALRRRDSSDYDLSQLRNLVFSRDSYGTNTELFGLALDILWSQYYLSAQELFDIIHLDSSIPMNSHVTAYDNFRWHHVVEQLRVEDLPIALHWLMDEMPKHREIDLSLSSQNLIAGILDMAWDNLNNTKILEIFSRTLWTLIDNDLYVMSDSRRTSFVTLKEETRNYNKELAADTDKRHLLFQAMLKWLTPQGLQDKHKLNDLNTARGLRFLTIEDIPWLVEQIEETSNDDLRYALLFFLKQFLPTDTQLNIWGLNDRTAAAGALIYQEMMKSDHVKANFESEFFVRLDSQRAQEGREWVSREKERRAKWAEHNPETFDLKQEITNLLDKDDGRDDLWFTLDQWLRSDIYGRYWDNTPLQNGEGWKAIQNDEPIVARVIEIALRYVRNWDINNISLQDGVAAHQTKGAISGYRALILLAGFQMLEQLEADDWEPWAVTIVIRPEHLPQQNAHLDSKLLENAFNYASNELFAELSQQLPTIDQYKINSTLRRFEQAPENALNVLLLDYFRNLTPENPIFTDLLRFLVRRNVHEAEDFALSFVSAQDDVSIQNSKRIINNIAFHSTRLEWFNTFLRLIEDGRTDNGDILNSIRSFHIMDAPYLLRLKEIQLQELYELAISVYPYSEDREFHGGAVPDWYTNQEWRDNLLKQIAMQGTQEAINYLNSLDNKNIKPSNIQYLLREARERYRLFSWIPPEPSNIFELVASKSKWLIRSEKQLLALINQILEQIETEFLHSQNKRFALWHQQLDGNFRPVKNEEHFSNAIAEWLQEKLPFTVINREPQIHQPLGKSKGNNTDILVEMFSDQDKKLTVIIEVKCCWYPKIFEKIQTQLVDDYIVKHPTSKTGLYLVGYFASDKWIDQQGNCSRFNSKVEWLEKLEETKQQLKKLSDTQVDVYVFDATI